MAKKAQEEAVAVVEAPEEPKPWSMPRVEVGDVIVYYPHGYAEREKYSATCTKTGAKCIELIAGYGFNNLVRFEVRHKDDPDLTWNTNFRANGAWDYSEMTYRLMALEEKVAKLESLIS